MLLTSSVHAQYYYSSDGTTQGGTGTWNTIDTHWGTAVGTYNTVWPNDGVAGAVFGGTGGTVTVQAGGVTVGMGIPNAFVSGITNSYINVASSGYTFSGGAVTFSAPSGVNDKVLYSAGNNTTGIDNLTINHDIIIKPQDTIGTVYVGIFSVRGNIGAAMTINGNIGLDSSQTAGSVNLRLVSQGPSNSLGGDLTINGLIKDYIGAGSGAKLSVQIFGRSNYSSTVTLTAANTYTGGTYVGGRVIATNNNSFGNSSGLISINPSGSTNDVTASVLTGAAITIANQVFVDGGSSTRGAAVIGGNTADISTYTGTIQSGGSPGTVGTPDTHTLLLTAAEGGTVNFNGQITALSSTTNPLALTKVGKGVVKLASNANNYTGGTIVNEGTLLVSNTSGSATGTGSVVVQGATVSSTATTTLATTNFYVVTVGSTSGLFVGQSVTGTGIKSGTYISKIIDGTKFLLSEMPLPISGNTYGSVELTFGTTNGVLAGTGFISGPVTINSGGTLTPGNISTTGILTVSNMLTFNAGSTYQWNVNSTAGTASTITANGVTIDSASVINLYELSLGSTITDGQHFTIINNTSASAINGFFSNLAQGGSLLDGGYSFQADYFGGDGNDLVLTATAIPETPYLAYFSVLAVLAIAYHRKLLCIPA